MFTKEFCNYIKGWAILLVIMVHVVYREDGNIFFHLLKMVFHQGDCGVNAFFFLSAYGLCHSYKKNSLCGFYIKRFVRIYPVYFFFVILLFYLFPQIDNRSIPNRLLMQVSGLVLLNKNVIIEWFVPALILLYLFFPLIYEGLERIGRFQQSLPAFMVVVGVGIPLFYVGLDVIHPYLLARWSAIVLGVMCYLLSARKNCSPLPLLIFAASLSLFSYQDCKFYFIVPLIIYALSRVDYRSLPMKLPMAFLGKRSFEVYLGQTLGLIWYYWHASGNIWMDLSIGLIISAASAVVLYYIQKYFWVFVHSIPIWK